MYWFRRPPYLRWAAAGLIVVAALYLDLREPPTVAHPFISAPLAAGDPVTDQMIEWRQVPGGLLPFPDLEGALASRSLESGEPLLPSSVGSVTGLPIPEGWWALTVELPGRAVPGVGVQLVLMASDPTLQPETVPGVVVETVPQDEDLLASQSSAGLVAVPAEAAARAAAAVTEGRAVVVIAP